VKNHSLKNRKTMENVNGKVAYITGGTKGIGWGIAQVLLNAGMKVAVSGRNLAQTDISPKQKDNENLTLVQADVRNFEEQHKAIESIKKHFGQIDLVVANAGIGTFESVETLSPKDWNEMIDTNLTGVFYTLKNSIEALKQTKGFFVSIASLAGINFFAGGAGYNASKFGVVGFAQAAMLDLRKHHVRVSTILPGSVNTHFNGNIPNEEQQDWKIQPQDIGQLILDLFKMDARSLPSKVEIRPTITANLMKK